MKYLIFILMIFIHTFFAKSQVINNFKEDGNYLKTLKNLKAKESNFETLVQIGDIYQQIGSPKKAVKNYKKALNIKEDITVKLKLAKSFLQSNQRENAIKIYQEILSQNQNNLLLKYRLANLYYQNKNYKKSEALFLELVQKDTNNASFYYKLASVYTNLKDYNNAISNYKKVVVLDTTNYKSYYHLAKTYRKLKEIDSTKLYLKKGLIYNQYDEKLNQLQVKVAIKAKDYPTVITSVKRLDSIKKATPFYKNLLGIAYYHNKEYHKAKKVFEKLFSARNVQDDTFYYLGLSYKALEKPKLAKKCFMLSIYSKRPSVDKEYYQIAMLYKAQNKPKKAIEFLKKSLKEKKYNPEVLYELGMLTEKFYKDKTIALKYYQEYISNFESLHPKRTQFILQQINKIKTALFMQK